MPGPAAAWSGSLVSAVREGRVPEESIDRKVTRMLLLASRVGALESSPGVVAVAPVDGRAFAREAAIEGMVLLANDGELPWAPDRIRSVAIIGQSALNARTQGGGSATVIPDAVVSPVAGLRAALPDAEIVYEVGAVVDEGITVFPLEHIMNPATGEHGVRVSFIADDGAVVFTENRRSSALVWFGGTAALQRTRRIVLETVYTPDEDGEANLGFASSKHGKVLVDGHVVIDEHPQMEGKDLGAALLDPPSVMAPLVLEAGLPIHIRAEFDLDAASDELDGAAAATIGLAPRSTDADALIARAAAAAAQCDVALVVVGTNSEVESEGFDRANLDLPGGQDDLVRAVVRANPRTVVVVNAGAPVLLPWRADAAAVILGYFGGQEFGAALGDVVTGAAEPGGRLPTPWPAALEDVPVLAVEPTGGTLRYEEGIHIGYRAWLAEGREPAYPFGWGLGYTSWSMGDVSVHGDLGNDDAGVCVRVVNTGDRPGKQVVQVYAERPVSVVERPVRWLVGSAVVRAEPGESVDVDIPIPARSLSYWEGGRRGGWSLEPGTFALRAGFSVADIHRSADIEAPSGS